MYCDCTLRTVREMEVGKLKGGSVVFMYPMLVKTNYTTWALKMRVFMQAQGVWLVVEQTDKCNG